MKELTDHFKEDRPYSVISWWQNFDDGLKGANEMFRFIFWLSHSGNPVKLGSANCSLQDFCMICVLRRVFTFLRFLKSQNKKNIL